MDFTVTVSRNRSYMKIHNSEGVETEISFSSGEEEISWTCRYLASVEVSTTPFVVKQPVNKVNEIIGVGSLAQGFTIDTFTTADFSKVVNAGLFLGANLFVEVGWTVKTMQNAVKFVVRECFAEIGEIKIAIIQGSGNNFIILSLKLKFFLE